MRISFPSVQLPAVIQPYAQSAKARITSALETFKQFDFQAMRSLAIRATVVSLVGVFAVTLYCFLRAKSKPVQPHVSQKPDPAITGTAPAASVTTPQPIKTAEKATIRFLEHEENYRLYYPSWCIYGDQRLSFGTTLKDKEGKPIVILPTDHYFEFEITAAEKKDIIGRKLILPSPLFKGVKEGDTVQFYNNNTLCWVTCSQRQQAGDFAFEEAMKIALENTSAVAMDPSDLKGMLAYKLVPILSYAPLSHQSLEPKQWELDESYHGEYRDLMVYPSEHEEDEQVVKTHLARMPGQAVRYLLPENVKKKEIICHVVSNHAGKFLLFVIPHKPELNKCSSPSAQLRVFDNEVKEEVDLPASEFDPKNHRLPGYNHGRTGLAYVEEADKVEFVERS